MITSSGLKYSVLALLTCLLAVIPVAGGRAAPDARPAAASAPPSGLDICKNPPVGCYCVGIVMYCA